MKSKFLDIIILTILIWLGISIMIQGFRCPDMTQTELILNSLNSLIFNFKHC